MAGILNSKERMIDFIITPSGRRQMADGRMRIEFATLSDEHTFYTSSSPSGVAEDASKRLFFETYSSTTDVITPELDGGDQGNNLQAFRAGSFQVEGTRFAEGTYDISTGSLYTTHTGSKIFSRAGELTKSITKHFEGMRILGTEDLFSNSTGFELSAVTGTFLITDQDLSINQGKGIYLRDLVGTTVPAMDDFDDLIPDGVVNLDYAPSIYTDPRFSHLPNYRYLPPRNLPKPKQYEDDPELTLGDYPDFSADPNGITLDKLFDDLVTRQSILVDFKETSRDNNIISQMFEFSNEGVNKLSIIDHGVSEDAEGNLRHIYFLGKIINDSNEVQTFMNIFTVVFEE